MHRYSKDSEDLKSDHRSSIENIEDQYAKSFAVGNSKNFVSITLPNVQIKGKQFYKKQPYCTICFRNFSTTFRQHHCRFCVNAVCKQCSQSFINKEKACDVCILRFTNIHEEKKKKEMLETLQTLCAFLIYQKGQKIEQLEKIKSVKEEDAVQKQLEEQEQIINSLEAENSKLEKEQQELEGNLDRVRENNAEIENKIAEIEKQMQGSGQDFEDDDN